LKKSSNQAFSMFQRAVGWCKTVHCSLTNGLRRAARKAKTRTKFSLLSSADAECTVLTKAHTLNVYGRADVILMIASTWVVPQDFDSCPKFRDKGFIFSRQLIYTKKRRKRNVSNYKTMAKSRYCPLT